MDFSKLYRPSALNSYQFIALPGLLMSAAAQLILRFFYADHPLPAGFGWLYVCWTGLYVVGALLNLFGKPGAGGHHHP